MAEFWKQHGKWMSWCGGTFVLVLMVLATFWVVRPPWIEHTARSSVVSAKPRQYIEDLAPNDPYFTWMNAVENFYQATESIEKEHGNKTQSVYDCLPPYEIKSDLRTITEIHKYAQDTKYHLTQNHIHVTGEIDHQEIATKLLNHADQLQRKINTQITFHSLVQPHVELFYENLKSIQFIGPYINITASAPNIIALRVIYTYTLTQLDSAVKSSNADMVSFHLQRLGHIRTALCNTGCQISILISGHLQALINKLISDHLDNASVDNEILISLHTFQQQYQQLPELLREATRVESHKYNWIVDRISNYEEFYPRLVHFVSSRQRALENLQEISKRHLDTLSYPFYFPHIEKNENQTQSTIEASPAYELLTNDPLGLYAARILIHDNVDMVKTIANFINQSIQTETAILLTLFARQHHRWPREDENDHIIRKLSLSQYSPRGSHPHWLINEDNTVTINEPTIVIEHDKHSSSITLTPPHKATEKHND